MTRNRFARARAGLAVAILFAAGAASADVRLPALFGDGMVLQRGRTIPVWGWADPGERVSVSFRNQTAWTTAGEDGKWRADLESEIEGGPDTLTVAGANRVEIADVLVGEVWVCSGQSNMQWAVSQSANPEAEIAAGNHPNLRLFYVPRVESDTPFDDVEAKWTPCTSETVANFSAVAYYFGRSLQEAIGVPIGLIHTSWGGTPAESWTRRDTLAGDPDFQPILDRMDAGKIDYEKQMKQYEFRKSAWNVFAERAKAAGKEAPPEPKRPGFPFPHRPGVLNNAMIAPLVPYAIAGAIWYQGESNAGRAYQYRRLFPTMIQDWRDMWGQGDFPFLFVQLANFMDRKPEPADSPWAELREAQTMTLSLPKTGMAVIIDIGEAKDIHPKNKQDVGARLALAARRVAYKDAGVSLSPAYRAAKIDAGIARVKFDDVGEGLKTTDGRAPVGFAVAGADRVFHWAEARIDGPDVVAVSSPKVPAPVAVRYAWADNPETNLVGSNGLPAGPFRTDAWPGATLSAR